MNTQLIVAMDVPAIEDIEGRIAALPASVRWYKIGLELFCAAGPSALRPFQARGCSVFLDLKLHDIPRTVERAVLAAAQHGIDLLTVHAGGGRDMLRAAAEAAAACGASRPRLLAVTVLTSIGAENLAELGVARSPADQALRLGELAVACGIDGLVCSPQEVAALRRAIGPTPLLVTPGIRLPGGDAGDQKRTGTPEQAARDGATHIVVGRPILEASAPADAVKRITESLEAGAR